MHHDLRYELFYLLKSLAFFRQPSECPAFLLIISFRTYVRKKINEITKTRMFRKLQQIQRFFRKNRYFGFELLTLKRKILKESYFLLSEFDIRFRLGKGYFDGSCGSFFFSKIWLRGRLDRRHRMTFGENIIFLTRCCY